jgi:hypothetical protein
MTMTKIYDLAYEVDGENINLSQGDVEPSYVVLHKIHLKHLSEVMNIKADEKEPSPMLVDCLYKLRDDARELYEFLNSVGSCPPSDKGDEDVQMAKRLVKTAEVALALWVPEI